MPVKDSDGAQKTYSATDVRQGEIILRSLRSRIIFVARLLTSVLLLLLVWLRVL